MAATEVANEQVDSVQESSVEKKNSWISIVVMIVVLIALISLPFVFIKLNVLGAGDMLRPYLKNNPILKDILPPTLEEKAIDKMNNKELLQIAQKDKATIASLQSQLEALKRVANEYTGEVDGFDTFKTEKANVEAQKLQNATDRKQLEADKAKFSEQIKNADRSSFEEFYKKIDATTAEKLYKESLAQDKVDSKITSYVSYYTSMDAASAAKIFEQLSVTNPNLVTNILYYMDKGKAAKILKEMDSKIASGISNMLAKKTPILR